MRRIALACVIAVTIAACGGATTAPRPATEPLTVTTPPGTTSVSDATPSAVASDRATTATPAGTPRPLYLTASLTDVRTGERFTLGGFSGKVTLVLAMAVW